MALTIDQRRALEVQAQRLLALDLEVNGLPINAPYELVGPDCDLKVRVQSKPCENGDVDYRISVIQPETLVATATLTVGSDGKTIAHP